MPDNSLCDHWMDLQDRRCPHPWKEEFKLTKPLHIQGGSMWGSYQKGTWRFCGQHANIFKKAKENA